MHGHLTFLVWCLHFWWSRIIHESLKKSWYVLVKTSHGMAWVTGYKVCKYRGTPAVQKIKLNKLKYNHVKNPKTFILLAYINWYLFSHQNANRYLHYISLIIKLQMGFCINWDVLQCSAIYVHICTSHCILHWRKMEIKK